jgi:hypothetical protein
VRRAELDAQRATGIAQVWDRERRCYVPIPDDE